MYHWWMKQLLLLLVDRRQPGPSVKMVLNSWRRRKQVFNKSVCLLATLHDHHPILLQNRPYLSYKTFLEPFPYLNAQLQILLKRKHCQSKVNACQSICIEGSQLEETKHQNEQIMLQHKKYAALIGLHLGFYKN